MSGGTVAAVDLGATSGRVMLSHVGPNELRLDAVARFPNTPVRTPDGLHWNILELFRSIVDGLGDARREVGAAGIASIGIDAWAVDYALLRGGRMLGTPYHYRDERTDAAVAAVHESTPFAELYAANGLQFLPFNTLYQFEAERASGMLDLADEALLIPDLIAYWLTGERVAESTNASTTGLLRVDGTGWNDELVARLGFPRRILPHLVQPGERIGTLLEHVASATGLGDVPVTAVGSHDTASAVVAVPMTGPDAAYISCGTWGLVGVELEHPVLTDASREANFTNEGGVDGRVRFLHNVMGLWLLSESVRTWEREAGETIDLPALLAAASAVTTPQPVFDANDARFMAPGDMPARIAGWLGERGMPVPGSRAEFVRCIIESLADAFAAAVLTAAELSGTTVTVIHIVGGGSQNELLCRLTAERAGMPVLAGPVEATALGNVLVQARATGLVQASSDLESLRALVARSFVPQRFEPTAAR